jgi:hypothetical protein
MAAILAYAAEVSTILAFLGLLPGTCAAIRKRAQANRHRRYRPRHARTGGSHRLKALSAAPRAASPPPGTRTRD